MASLVMTIAVGIDGIYELTRPFLEQYASSIGADFYAATETTRYPPHLAKLDELRRHAGQYDHILYVDADVYIRPGAPNIFEAYPESALFSEIPHPRPDWLRPSQQWIKTTIASDWPDDRYFNTGVIVLNRDSSLSLARQIDQCTHLQVGPFFEQEQLNVLLRQACLPTQSLDQKWNQFYVDAWCSNQQAQSAYFLHATGGRSHDKQNVLKTLIHTFQKM